MNNMLQLINDYCTESGCYYEQQDLDNETCNTCRAQRLQQHLQANNIKCSYDVCEYIILNNELPW